VLGILYILVVAVGLDDYLFPLVDDSSCDVFPAAIVQPPIHEHADVYTVVVIDYGCG
jgi:hypothetical protein